MELAILFVLFVTAFAVIVAVPFATEIKQQKEKDKKIVLKTTSVSKKLLTEEETQKIAEERRKREEEHQIAIAEKLRVEEEKQREFNSRINVVEGLPPLPPDVHGIITKRYWNVANSGQHILLASTGVSYYWKEGIETTEKIHGNAPYGGIHAYRITDLYVRNKGRGSITGLIEMRGKVVRHKDDVFRAEWARILWLMGSEYYANVLKNLSAKYRVPVVIVKDSEKGVFLDKQWSDKITEGYNRWVQAKL